MTPNPSLPAAPVEAAQPSDEQIDRLFESLLDSGSIRHMPTYTEGRRIARAVLALSPPAVLVEPAGWKLVPIEPTEAMIAAMRKAWQDAVDRDADDECRAEYIAAIAAAPAVPLEQKPNANVHPT